MSGRVMAVDFGEKRYGLALSDPLGVLAQPLDVLKGGRRWVVQKIAELAREHQVTTIVVGVPVLMSGGEGTKAVEAREFAAELQQATQLAVETVDERLTTRVAQAALLEADMRRDDRKQKVDKVAAAIILQGWLDARRSRGAE